MVALRYTSPLRYPGGKGRLANFIKLTLQLNGLLDGRYVEPYAGGASVALHLLFGEYVHEIFINDLDVSVYAFWYSVLNHTDEICKRIHQAPVTVDEWLRNKAIRENLNDKAIRENLSDNELLDLGFSTFFLNRTNRSGILTGGLIGGLDQTGKWKIGARFNKAELIKRIEKIARYRNRIHLTNMDASDFLIQFNQSPSKRTFIYLDPPYYRKGQDLYKNYYSHQDHAQIARLMSKETQNKWLITYDSVDEIQDLYSQFRKTEYSLSYSASRRYKGSEIMVFCHDLAIPQVQGSPLVSNKTLGKINQGQLSLELGV